MARSKVSLRQTFPKERYFNVLQRPTQTSCCLSLEVPTAWITSPIDLTPWSRLRQTGKTAILDTPSVRCRRNALLKYVFIATAVTDITLPKMDETQSLNLTLAS